MTESSGIDERATQARAPVPAVLFYTDNGLGLGHLTRQAAVAMRARDAFRPVFLTMSAGITLLRQLGLPGEYFPSYGRLGITKQQWEPLIAERLIEAIGLTGASAVVVDHVSPPKIFAPLRRSMPGVEFIWSRRGLWQPGKNRGVETMGRQFDRVVEPGDLASPIDQGATVPLRPGTVAIAPVLMTDADEFLPRDEARERLGIPKSGRAILINLGDSDPTEIGRLISHTRSVIESAGQDQIHLFAPLHPLHGDRIPDTDGVIMRPIYPVAPCFNAFDGAVSTAGYNSFHEIVASGMPAVFVPHRGASIDDQVRRAEFAALCGRAHWAADVYSDAFQDAVRRMLRPWEADIARKTTSALGDMTGAEEFAGILADWVGHGANGAAGGRRSPQRVVTQGSRLGRSTAFRKVVDATGYDDAQLRDLALGMADDDLEACVVVVRDGNPKPLFDRGVVFESLMSEREWGIVGGSDSYGEYVDARFAGITGRYGTTRIIPLHPGETPESGTRPGAPDENR